MELIAQALNSDLSKIASLESKFAEGDTGELRVYVSQPLSDSDLERIQQELVSKGVVLTEPIFQESRILVIRFKKEIAPLLIIGAVVAAVAAVASGIVGWQIFKLNLGVPWYIWAIGGAALLYIFLKKPAQKAGGLAIQAGKVYVTKGMLK